MSGAIRPSGTLLPSGAVIPSREYRPPSKETVAKVFCKIYQTGPVSSGAQKNIDRIFKGDANSAERALSAWRLVEIKEALKYLKKTHPAIRLQGNKASLIRRIISVLIDDGFLSRSESSNNEISFGAISSANYDNPQFLQKQNPFFKPIEQILAVPIYPSGLVHRFKFVLSANQYTDVRSLHSLVTMRLFTESNQDHQWNFSNKVLVNGTTVNIAKCQKRLRIPPGVPYLRSFSTPYPLELSSYLKPGTNTLQFMYSRSYKGTLVVQRCKALTTAQLLPLIPKATKDLGAMTRADGIEVSRSKVSLNCPLSCMRLQNPGRGEACSHAQCFDLEFYLEYCKQQLVWHCPICQKATPFHKLYLDEKALALIHKISPNVDVVLLDSSGNLLEEPKAVALDLSRSSVSPPASNPTEKPVPEPNLKQENHPALMHVLSMLTDDCLMSQEDESRLSQRIQSQGSQEENGLANSTSSQPIPPATDTALASTSSSNLDQPTAHPPQPSSSTPSITFSISNSFPAAESLNLPSSSNHQPPAPVVEVSNLGGLVDQMLNRVLDAQGPSLSSSSSSSGKVMDGKSADTALCLDSDSDEGTPVFY